MKQTILLTGLFPAIKFTHNVRIVFLSLVLLFVMFSSAFAATKSYTGTSGGNWNVDGNWTPSGVPGSSDDVTIVGKTVVIQSGDAITINRLSLQTSATAAAILNITGGNLTINQTTGTASNDACYLQGGTVNNSGGTVSITNSLTSATGAGLRFGTSAGTFKASSTFNNAGTGTLSVSTPSSTNGTPCIIMNQNDAGYHPTFTIGGTITITPNSGSATMAIECASPVGAVINGTGTLTAGTSGSPVIYTFVRCQAGNSATLSATIETGVTLNYFGSNSCIYVVTAGTTVANSATITNKGTINVGGTTRFPFYILSSNTLSGVASTFDNQGTITANGAFSTGNSGVIYMAGAGTLNSFTNSGTINFNTTTDQTTECNVIRVSGTNVNASITNSGTITVGSNKALTNAIVLGDSKSTLTNTGTINIADGQITGTSGTGYVGNAAFNNNAGGILNLTNTTASATLVGNTALALNNNGGSITTGSTANTVTLNTGTPGATFSSGSLSPGGDAANGKVTITSSVTLAGTVKMNVTGVTTAGTDYDQIISSTSSTVITVSGTLALNMSASAPAIGTTIDIIKSSGTNGTVSGTFSNVTGLTQGWALVYSANTISLKYNANITYTGTSGGDWNLPSNWDLGHVPGSTENVIINGKSVVIQTGDAITINRLSVQSSASAAGILNITGGSLTINQIVGTASNEACILQGGTINNTAGTVSITNDIASGTGAGLRLASANAGTFSSTFNNAGTGTLSINTTATTTSWPCITINQNTASTTPTLTVGGTITLTPNPGTTVGTIDVSGSAPAQINGTGTITIGSAGTPVGYSFLRCASGNTASLSATIETGVTLNYYGNNNTNVSCLYVSTSGTTAAQSATITNKGTINVGGTTRSPVSIAGASTQSGSTASFVNQGTLTANGAFAGNTTPGVIFMAGAGYLNSFTNSGTINFNTTADQTTDCSVIKVYGVVNASIANSGTITVGSNQALTNAIVLGDSKSSLTNTGTINLGAGKVTGTSGAGYTGSAAFNNNAEGVINTSKTDQASAFTSTIALTNNGTINYNFPNITGNVNLSTFGDCSSCDLAVSNGGEFIINATKTVRSLTVAPGAKLTLSSGTLTATNGVTLESDATGTATLLGSAGLTGTVTAKQYLGSARNWYVSSPVSSAGAPATNVDYYYEYVEGGNNNDFATQPGSSSLYWKGIPNGTTMEVGKGYIAKTTAGTTVQFSGTHNNGDITTAFNLTRNDTKGKGFNLVGNPYPSYLDWVDVAAANTNLDNSYYYRTKNSASGYTFVTWNGAGSNYVVSNGSLPVNTTVTRYIPPTQAFWVRVKSGTSSTAMNFTNTMREHRDDNGNLMKAKRQDTRTSIRLQLQNGSETDELLIYQDEAASNSYDAFDSPKMMNNSSVVPDLYSKVGDERLVINGLNAIVDNMELPLGFSLNAAASLKLKATELNNLPEGAKLYLRDKHENEETELTPTAEYSFSTTIATTNNESRFSLIFRAPNASTGIENAKNGNTQVFVNAANQITIISPDKAMYTIYNAMGQLIETGIVNMKHKTQNAKLNAGVYVVKVNNQSSRVIVN